MTMRIRDQHPSVTTSAMVTETDESAFATVEDVGTQQQTRLNWSDSGQRLRHIAVFRAWLPDVLARAPFIAWDDLPSQLMGYLVRTVDSSPAAIPITLAGGAAMHGVRPETLTRLCRELANLLQRLRTRYGMHTIADLAERGLWEAYTANRRLSSGEVNALTFYDSLTKSYLPLYFQRLDLAAQHRLQQYVLPALPIHFMKHSGQRNASRATAEKKRKSQSDILVPLLPLLVELVQFRKQSMERLWKEIHRQIALVEADQATLPVHFTLHERVRSVNSEARTLGDVHLIERDVDLQLILWDKPSWVTAHPERYGKDTRRAAHGRRRRHNTNAYAPENNAYFVQHLGPAAHLLWFGDLIAAQVLGRVSPSASDTRQAAAKAVERGGFFTSRPGLLVPTKAHAVWLGYAAQPGEQLFEPDALYRGVLYGAALATLAMTSAARVNELLQISAIRWRRLAIPVLQDGRNTGRAVHKAVQMLLPKGKRQERDRQVFVISDAAFRLLMEIHQLLAQGGTAAHTVSGTEHAALPWIEPYRHSKADDLAREPYLFQWAADEDGRLGLLRTDDVTKLLRFMLHGIHFTTREGVPIQFAIHLIRHIVATYARHEALIPPEAIAVMLHHETVPASSSPVSIPVATEYYSKMPIEDALMRILAFQAQLAREQGATLLRAPSPDDLTTMDSTLRQIFETWGSIGPTPFGWCGAGRCVRTKGRGNCIGCEWMLPDFRQIAHVRQWRRIYEQTLRLAEEQGLAIQASEARGTLEWLDGIAMVMRLQFQAHLDSGYLPAADRLLPQDSREDLLNE